MPTVELHPDAVLEAKAARRWYRKRSPIAAELFAEELDAAIATISESPNACASYLEGTRRYVMKRFPFIVVFHETPSTIEIIAIAHGHFVSAIAEAMA